ncbi:FAD-binding domain [Methylosinus sp. KRF6]|uniref:FAD-binding domain n=1 Tax=Methylosinus sp. KRF6 TaxID=2846853 RepID=UPI001C0B0826|nr:FAD-binding domain [Methylosinus sp. KRF6]MBU3887903.1 FAD-binding domain [Methylosinus sp. KRF6]
MKIAISGAGIAGATLSYWLLRAGHEPLLIEHAPSLRTGGYIMDFWGLGYSIAERMGVLPAVRRAGYQVEEVRFLADDGRKVGGFSVDALRDAMGGRMTSVARGDLAAAIYRSIDGRVEIMFDEQISMIDEHEGGVRIALRSGETRDVDLLVGADGLHSRVRELIFGSEDHFEKDLGYRFAVFETNGYATSDENAYVIHAAASRQIGRFTLRDGRTLCLLVFRSELSNGAEPNGRVETQALLKMIFDDAGWESGRILAAMEAADDVYYDRVSQIRMSSWHSGRVALIGDAGMAVSFLAGEGAGLAMTEAYVLAGEISRAPGDHAKAFAAYDARLRPFIEGKQRTAESFASTFVPQTELGIWLRNQATKLMALPGAANLMLGKSLRDDFALPDYL